LLAALTETPAPVEAPEPRATAPVASQNPAPVTAATAVPRAAESLRREIREVRQMLEMLVAEQPGIGLPRECFAYYRRMLASGLPRKTAAALLASIAKENDPGLLREEAVFKQCLRREIRRRVAVTGGIALNRGERHTVAMIGATGVGKTTNLAKLAARYALHEHARVALVTIDTYRVAAPDQLRVYANIMGIPLCVANDADEVRAIMKRLRDYDLVLIDTAGGSPFNREQIAELRTTLAAANADEVIQVISATTPHDDLPHVLSGFRTLRPTALMITKLDETRRHGAVYATLAEARLPLSFLGVGQNVPDDLVLAQPDTVVDYLMESGDENG
jgi:flagellar biosynthesis protein FlhF